VAGVLEKKLGNKSRSQHSVHPAEYRRCNVAARFRDSVAPLISPVL
jgi:hypothetical protein